MRSRVDGSCGQPDKFLQRLYSGVTAATAINWNETAASDALADVCSKGERLAIDANQSAAGCFDASSALPTGVTAANVSGVKPILGRCASAVVLQASGRPPRRTPPRYARRLRLRARVPAQVKRLPCCNSRGCKYASARLAHGTCPSSGPGG
jgi:hypothetical protein